jgi:acyl carrier protein
MSDAKSEVRGTVQKLIADILARKKKPTDPSKIVEGVSLTRDLGIDSLDILQLSAAVEKRYSIRFPQGDLRRMDDLSGILEAIAKLRAEGG